jgi:hypothetical protein
MENGSNLKKAQPGLSNLTNHPEHSGILDHL